MKLKSDKKEFIGNQKSTKVDKRLTKQNLAKIRVKGCITAVNCHVQASLNSSTTKRKIMYF